MYFPKINRTYLAVFSGNLLMFACGTTLTWSSSEVPKLADPSTSPFNRKTSPDELSWISSVLTLGGSLGPFMFGYLAEKIGRKSTSLYLALPFVVCHLFLAFSNSVETFIVLRFIVGLAVGGTFIVVPIYIVEISEKSNRGALSSSSSCFVCFGILFSCALGPYVSVSTFNLILGIIPLLYLLLFSLFAPESPYYYISVKETDSAKDVLAKLRGSKETIEHEIAEIQLSVKDDSEISFDGIFKSRALSRALVISIGLLVFQQFSGINAVIFYGQQIFQQIGTNFSPEICTIIVVFVQFLSSFLTPFIVDKFGRKIILIFSAIGMAISEIPLGVYCYLNSINVDVVFLSFIPVLTLTIFIFSFNCGFGPLPWTLLCELLPSNIKSFACAFVSFLIWMLAFFITKYFEAMVEVFGVGQLFLIFSFCCMLAALFTLFFVVETKGKSFQEIQEILDS